ncbi:MAG TPA: DegT/DnrJ/EryC1/StrS family aminotransferase, partial [Candidatus Nanoarchaeia archaeon]|nr:DegT/DnrJ/EryC1/StrS family aminotransferase [Candidatus Nanoarchaeia archaeon]
MEWKIPLFSTYFDQDDLDAVNKVIKRGTYWATGPEIEQLEKKTAEYIGTKHALSFNSGTSALHCLLLAYNLKGSEVIVPSFSFIATANAVVLAGATPIFAESEEETFGLDFEDVKKRITPKTKAIIPLHYGGCVSRDIKKIQELCFQNNLLLLDDAAESLGAGINGEKVGSFSDASMFSLCQNKIISAGEGGLVVTSNTKVYEKMKLLRSHGRFEKENTDYFSSIDEPDYLELGYNFRLPTMSAALALSQLNKIKTLIELRQKNAAYFNQSFKDIPEITRPLPPSGFDHFYQMYTIILPDETIRNQLQQFLITKGIQTRPYFHPIHLKTFYSRNYGYSEGNYPRTEQLA